MRYFLELAYNGTRFNGFQIQPNDPSVQEAIQLALKTILRQETEIVGCGRTDTGVHALQYFAHFDFEGELPDKFVHRLNSVLGRDIAIYRCFEVAPDAHARFDAVSRSYEYHVDTRPNPFTQETAFFFSQAALLDIPLMQAAAATLLEFKEFDTFCKTHTDAKTRLCRIDRAEWVWEPTSQQWVFHIRADRFLRGMVRLIVGMCLNVGRGMITLDELREALEQQKPLQKAWSVPAQGLFLKDIKYLVVSKQ